MVTKGLVEGRCSKQQAIDSEERTSVCGCLFQCQNWGKGESYWIRIKDCKEHLETVRKAVK